METERADDHPAWPSPQTTEGLLAYVLLPVWFVPGVLDWYWHRRTRIEETAGARESVLHLLMEAEAGIPVAAFLFLEVDAGVIAASALAVALHQATVMWDVAYATPRRKVAPAEQHTHSWLEVLPMMTAAALACSRPDQVWALLGRGPERPRFAFRPKRKPLPRSYVAAMLLGAAAFVALPFGEELLPLPQGLTIAAQAPRAAAPAHDRRPAVDPRARRGRLGSLARSYHDCAR